MKKQILTFVALGLALVTGCQTPDLKPFADSTAELQRAVVRGQKIVDSELKEIQARQVLEGDGKAKLEKAQEAFAKAYAQRLRFMEAVVEYSDSLAALADAGKNGQANAEALGNSVKKLAGAAGPYGQAVGVASDIVGKLFGLTAQALAFHSLREATANADPIIAAGAQILETDLKNIADTLATAKVPLIVAIQKPNEQAIAQRNKLIRFRDGLSSEITNAISTPPQTNWPVLLEEYNQKTAQLDQIINATDKWYLPLQEQIGETRRRLDAEVELMDATVAGFKQWQKVHADLAQALKENRSPNIRALISAALEIKAEIENLKKH